MMSKINLIIFDEDINYIKALGEFFYKKYYKFFKVTIISKYEEFEKLVGSVQKMDILLVNESLKYKVESLKSIRSLITLTEHKENQDIDSNILYKYQKGQYIFNFIKRTYKLIDKSFDFGDDYDEARLISVFSPVGGSGKTSISISLASKLIYSGKKVLYINMEEISCMEIFFELKKKQKSMSDLFYNINKDDESIKEIISSIISKGNNGIWYIKHHDSILDLTELSINDFSKAITYLKRHSGFDYIIADLGSLFNANYSTLMELSERVMVIMEQTNVSTVKNSVFLNSLESLDKVNLILNKYNKDKHIEITNEISKVTSGIFQYIELDDELINNNLNLEKLTSKSRFSLNMGQLTEKILREDAKLNG